MCVSGAASILGRCDKYVSYVENHGKTTIYFILLSLIVASLKFKVAIRKTGNLESLTVAAFPLHSAGGHFVPLYVCYRFELIYGARMKIVAYFAACANKY